MRLIIIILFCIGLVNCSKGDFDPTITVIKEVIKSTKSKTYEDKKE
jgi:hypothetical protein